jgi:hypothetical protein
MGGSAGGRCSATSVGMVSGRALRRDRSTRCLSVRVVVVLPGGTATTPPPPCSAVLVCVLRRTVSATAGLEEIVFAMALLMTGIKPVCCAT